MTVPMFPSREHARKWAEALPRDFLIEAFVELDAQYAGVRRELRKAMDEILGSDQ